MNAQSNITYVFIPFRFRSDVPLAAMHTALMRDGNWDRVQDEIKYMFKYVAEKHDGNDPEKCRSIHYSLTTDGFDTLLGVETDTVLYTAPHLFDDRAVQFDFCLQSVQLYCFGMGVGILAFGLHFPKSHYLWISSALYHMKKVSKEKVYALPDSTDDQDGVTLLELARRLMSPVGSFDFFFYANTGTERSNVLSYIEAEEKESYAKELYYLRRCYNESFLYAEDEKKEASEIFSPSPDVHWGVSPEAAACVVCPTKGRVDFIRTTFYKNFNAQYLFMYVLLLHQKYMLYLFLTQIGVGMSNDLKMLERYRKQLYEFETDFVFTQVTEVEQYQRLYTHMSEAFALKRMFKDVHEPLISLGQVRQKEAEKAQEHRSKKLSFALALFSMIGLISALTDGWVLAKHIANFCFGGKGAVVMLLILVTALLALFGWVIKILLSDSKD